eukprot:Gregarina_sp_Pseudo_9__372@NODE_1240_length_1747_cov_256_183255_g1166_i0_p1_GENE_NODE_1240_length_1747_cov_256_183255_g1166_i0NODE_1240_length_1747_cov_256_183255_g1166_i0_p1_ORF_typecomplete_len485_score95_80Hexokinase_2/PF03727_16/2e48Hexokinase_1/PF00349_21/3_8e47PRRSV_Env/PF02340_15/0_17PRRSV_Env/PF02340_15/13_NODE_1240_length_1747_cov_256_183255_g1166_i0851539
MKATDASSTFLLNHDPFFVWQRYKDQIRVDEQRLKSLYEGVLNELKVGLAQHKKEPFVWSKAICDFMMIDCCLDKVPRGTETGSFYALDFGGTNIRAVRVRLDGNGSTHVDQLGANLRDEGVSANLPKGVLDAKAPATMLFDAVASRIKQLMEKTGDIHSKTKLPVGFTFSFGFRQTALDSASLCMWGKDFETGLDSNDPVINQDVCRLMNQAFERAKIPAYVNCILNDTTGTMIIGGMEKGHRLPPCLIGLIVGTGVNGCYFEPEARMYGYQGNVINVETGGFSKELPICVVDAEIDHESANRGHQQLEKLTSGLYVPEVIRLLILRCFQKLAPEKAWERGALGTPSLAAIYAQNEGDTDMAGRVMMQEWDWSVNKEDLKVIKQIVDAVFDRSAGMTAVVVAAMAKKTKRLQPAMGGVTVGVDGSMYTKNPKYQQRVNHFLQLILGEQLAALIHFQITADGSGKGAACLAATVAEHSPQTLKF